jgi:hypothetical protein
VTGRWSAGEEAGSTVCGASARSDVVEPGDGSGASGGASASANDSRRGAEGSGAAGRGEPEFHGHGAGGSADESSTAGCGSASSTGSSADESDAVASDQGHVAGCSCCGLTGAAVDGRSSDEVRGSRCSAVPGCGSPAGAAGPGGTDGSPVGCGPAERDSAPEVAAAARGNDAGDPGRAIMSCSRPVSSRRASPGRSRPPASPTGAGASEAARLLSSGADGPPEPVRLPAPLGSAAAGSLGPSASPPAPSEPTGTSEPPREAPPGRKGPALPSAAACRPGASSAAAAAASRLSREAARRAWRAALRCVGLQ